MAELIGTAVTLTGDELQFQCLSASTHPTGYAWEEKAGQVSNVMSRAKTWKHHRITVHQHQHQLVWDKSDAFIRLITSKWMKQSYPQLVFWSLFGLSSPNKQLKNKTSTGSGSHFKQSPDIYNVGKTCGLVYREKKPSEMWVWQPLSSKQTEIKEKRKGVSLNYL